MSKNAVEKILAISGK